MTRPDYIKCIKHTIKGRTGAWCGKPVLRSDSAFEGIEHAAYNGLREGRLVACPDCVEAITDALRNGHEPSPSILKEQTK